MMKMRKNPLRKPLCLLMGIFLGMGLFSWPAAGEEEQAFLVNEWNYVEGSMDISGGIPETAGGVLARIRDRGVLTVATEPYFAPQEFIDPALDGQDTYAGADMELARLIAEKMGVELVIVPMEFTEVLPAVAEDRCDLAISALSFTPSRAITNEMSKGYYFADTPVNVTLLIRAEDAETILSTDDLAERTMIAQQGSLQEAIAVEHIHRYLEFRRVAQVQTVYEAVASGTADAGVVDMDTAQDYLLTHPESGMVLAEGIRFSLEEQYAGDRIAAKKGEAELLYFVNGVIDEVLEKGLYTEWYREAQKRADELGL